jgi:hypothetical protein
MISLVQDSEKEDFAKNVSLIANRIYNSSQILWKQQLKNNVQKLLEIHLKGYEKRMLDKVPVMPSTYISELCYECNKIANKIQGFNLKKEVILSITHDIFEIVSNAIRAHFHHQPASASCSNQLYFDYLYFCESFGDLNAIEPSAVFRKELSDQVLELLSKIVGYRII